MKAKQFSGRVHGERRAPTAKKVKVLTSAIWLSGICASPMALAQQVVADGTTVIASGTIDTGTTPSIPGYGLYATNGGVIQSVSPLTLITAGNAANPVAVDTGGQISLFAGSSISGAGGTSYGLYADGANSQIHATNTTVSMTGPSSDGAYVRNNGTISVNGGSLAGSSYGAFAFTGGAFSATDTTITSSGDAMESAGVEANTDGHVTLTRGSVTNTGTGPGLYVLDNGANASLPTGALTATGTTVRAVGEGALVDSGKMVLNDVSITTTGMGGTGAIVGQEAVLTMTGGSVTTLADQAAGIESNDFVSADHVTVSTMGSGSLGISGQFGGVIQLSNSDVKTAGPSGLGALAYGEGQVIVTDSHIATTGDSAHGAMAQAGGLLTLTNSIVGTSGAGAFGLVAVLGGSENDPSQVTVSGSTITTTGASSHGVILQGLASLGMTNSSVSTTGVGADALYATYSQDASTGLVEDANSATLTGSSLTSAQAAGLMVQSQLTVTAMQGSAITGHTNAMEVVEGGALDLVADQSTLTGGATLATGATSSVTLQNGSLWTMTAPVAVTDLSLDASTVRLGAAGVTVTTATPIVLGAGGATFDTNGFDTALTSSLSGPGALYKVGAGTLGLTAANTYAGDTIVNGGTLALQGAGDVSQSSSVSLAQAGSAFNIAGLAGASTTIRNFSGVVGSQLVLGGKTLSVTQDKDSEFAGDIDASSGSFVKNGAGTLTLSGTTGYTGTTTLNAGELILDGTRGGAQLTSDVVGVAGTTLMLSHGATLTGSVDPIDLDIDAPSVWDITANSTVDTLTLGGRAGFVAPAEPFTAGRTLRVTNLVGNGGTIGLYAALGNSSSSSDQVVIDGGSATGLTHLAVHNAGGLGDQTTGDGIRVVGTVNGGVTDAKAFDLSGRVLAGPYEYTLQRGGASAANDWFLTSDLAPQDTAGSPGTNADNAGNGGTSNGNGNGSVIKHPNYRAETSLYSDLSSQALGYGEAVLGTIQERMGADGVSDVGNVRSVWTRALGQSDRDTGARDGIAGHEVASRIDLTGLQVGGDLYAESNGDRRTSVGVYVATGESQGTVDHAGTNTLKAYSLAAYGTWLDGKGGYLDAVVQGTHYDIRSQSVNAMSLTTTAKGLAASLEAGKAYELGKGLSLEPQAQLIYQTVDTGRAHDQAGSVAFDRAGQGQLRVGARLNRALDINGPTPSGVWVGVDVLQSAGGAARTKFATVTQGNVSFDNQNVGTRLGLQTGIDALLARNVWLDAHFGVERSIDGGHLTSVSGQVGLKVAF